MAKIPPPPPVPHADGTSSGPHSARKHRHASSLPRLQKKAPPTHPSNTALRTQRLKTRTCHPVTDPVPPLTLLLAPNEAKATQTTVIHHGAQWRIPKHHMTARDLPKVPHDSQGMPRTCWACEPEAPTKPWPVLHIIACHHTHPTTHLPPQAYTWVAPWFHRTDANPTVVWIPDHSPQWVFTTTPTCPCPDPAGVAIRYSMYEPGRTGKHEHPNIRSTTPATHRSTENKPSHATT